MLVWRRGGGVAAVHARAGGRRASDSRRAAARDRAAAARPRGFTCLRHPGVEATNWQAEQAIRPAVVTRKVCGGNRSPRGAATQQVVASVLRTAWQQQRDPLALLVALQCSPR